MKVAIPLDAQKLESSVCLSFGRAPYFAVYDTETQESEFVINSATASPGGAGIKAAQTVVDAGAEVLLTPRCGENAAEVLHKADVAIYKSTSGTAQENITAFLANELTLLRDFRSGAHHG